MADALLILGEEPALFSRSRFRRSRSFSRSRTTASTKVLTSRATLLRSFTFDTARPRKACNDSEVGDENRFG